MLTIRVMRGDRRRVPHGAAANSYCRKGSPLLLVLLVFTCRFCGQAITPVLRKYDGQKSLVWDNVSKYEVRSIAKIFLNFFLEGLKLREFTDLIYFGKISRRKCSGYPNVLKAAFYA